MTNAENILRQLADTMQKEGDGAALALLKTLDAGAVKPAPEGAAFHIGITAAALLQKDFPPVQWLVDGVIPGEGLTLLAGAPKVGKSWLTLQLAIAVSSGGDFWGLRTRLAPEGERKTIWDTTPPAPERVLYLALEDNERRLQKRLRLLGAEGNDKLTLCTAWASGTAGADALDAYLEANPDTRLVIIDTLGRFFGQHDGNDYSQTTALAGRIQNIATQRKVCILGIHHTRKSAARDGDDFGGDWQDGVLSSQGLAGAADACLLLQKGRGQSEARLRGTGRDFDREPDFALTLDIAGAHGWRLAGGFGEVQSGRTRQLIFDAVKAAGEPIKPSEAYKAVQGDYSGKEATIRAVMAKMSKDGTLCADKSGRYTLPMQETGEA